MDNFQYAFHKAYREAGLEPCSPHTLRHTFAFRDLSEGRLRSLRGPHRLLHQFDPEVASSFTVSYRLRYGGGIGCIVEVQDSLQAWYDLMEEFQVLGTQIEVQICYPVMLPPGRAKLWIKPNPTGSLTVVKTIGTRVVAICAAFVGLSWEVKMMSTPY